MSQAIEFYNHAIELDPNYSKSYTQLGWARLEERLVFARIESLNAAEKAFESALYLNPKEETALLGMAWVTLGQFKWTNAVEHYQAARDLNAPNSVVFEAWYRALVEAKFNEANSMLDLMGELDPLAINHLIEKGRLTLVGGMYQEAAQSFSDALEIKPESGQALTGLAWSYLHDQSIEQARTYFQKSKQSVHNTDEVDLILALLNSGQDLQQTLADITPETMPINATSVPKF